MRPPSHRRFRSFARLVILLAPLFAGARAVAAEGPTPQALWREVLAGAKSWTLPSHDEPGYQLIVTVSAPADRGALRAGLLSFQWSEIDTTADEPVWKKPWSIARRAGLPAQIIVSDAGVFWLTPPKSGAAITRHARGAPTFTGSTGVTERVLKKGTIYCFSVSAPRKKGGAPVEICLAPGEGVVAAKGVVAQHPLLLFVQPGWVEAH